MDIDKIKRVALGRASKREQEDVNVWAESSKERKRLLVDAKLFYGREMFGEDEISDRVERMWNRRRIPVGKRRAMIWLRWMGVAVCMIGIVGIALRFVGETGNKKKNLVVADNKEVCLILPDGSSHGLSTSGEKTVNIPGFRVNREGTIQENGAVSQDTDITDVEYNEIVVPRGGEYSLTLADGTVMRLNSDTRVRFPNTFVGVERRVFLDGEAYFEVARQTGKHKFTVESKLMTVVVHGTIFNMKSYDQATVAETSLIEGEVLVESGDDDSKIILLPGQKAIVEESSHKMVVKETNSLMDGIGRNNMVPFQNATIQDIAKVLEDLYHVKIEVRKDIDLTHTYSGMIEKKEKLEDVMKTLQNSIPIRYKIESDKVLIEPME